MDETSRMKYQNNRHPSPRIYRHLQVSACLGNKPTLKLHAKPEATPLCPTSRSEPHLLSTVGRSVHGSYRAAAGLHFNTNGRRQSLKGPDRKQTETGRHGLLEYLMVGVKLDTGMDTVVT